MVKCRRYIVSGLVQGVGFRYHTYKQAVRIGLTGWVRNLAGGEVEIVACGGEGGLADLEGWLDHGPPAAQVRGVESEEMAAAPGFREFSIR